VGQYAEKLLAARIAAVGRKAEKALHKNKGAVIDSIAGNVQQIEIPASRAVRVTREGQGHAPGVKAPIARAASPGTELKEGGEEIRDAPPMRSETFFTSALRTNHFADWSSNWARAEYRKRFSGASAGNVYARHAGVSKIDDANPMTGYTDKHASAGIDAKLPAIETWPNQFPGYTITIRIPEYTSVCPKTGLPDYGAITIQYEPKKLCLELKSLKLYLLAYRNLGIFYENAVNRILKDVVASVKPVWCRVTGDFTPRGGLTTSVEARWPRGGH